MLGRKLKLQSFGHVGTVIGDTGAFGSAILAAGNGRRMLAVGERIPKALIPVCNRPIIEHQILALRASGITETVIVVGYRADDIITTLGDGRRLGVRLSYLHQQEPQGIAHAVGLLEPIFRDRPFLVLLGDIFFITAGLTGLLGRWPAQGWGAVLVSKDEPDPAEVRKNAALVLDRSGLVLRIVEKPQAPPSTLRTVGIYLFGPEIFSAIRATPCSPRRNEYEISDAVQTLIERGAPVSHFSCVEADINMTTPEEILRTNIRCLTSDVLIGKGCILHPQALITRSVVGAHVTVRHGITIADSVVFAGCDIDLDSPLEHAVVLPDLVIRCGATALGARCG